MRRYHLPCSEETGKLVERTCDALVKRRATKGEKAKETAKLERAAKRAERDGQWMVGTMDLRVELKWMVKHFELHRLPTVTITRGRAGSRGYAYFGSRQYPGAIRLTIGERASYTSQCAQMWEYLLHEVIHSFGVPHGAEMCAEVDRACLARWNVDVRSGSQGFPTGRVGKEKTYTFDRVAIVAICETVAKTYTDPPRRPTRQARLKKKWGVNALRIADRSQSAQEIDAVIIDPVESNPDADPETKAMVEWLKACHQHGKRFGYYIFEVNKESLPHVRIFIRELRDWAWDVRMRPFHSWASQLEVMVNRIEKETPA